ncbi:DsbA family protein [Pontixanthobacter aquaemixtae]|uniref:Thioredoxin domain-containing protein n=1 Tax=Pontixanthobacter aquaemixtae TaxID=1958940 RepID=A0A844ZX11_9SPHN|nr:thioredoxin domain-containing protein [Pontixanthobacter aquaemixtae]MXO91486.1 thioredoxin domain-containing protein [Pontixanthobacter aquaemixtae]
MQDNSKRSLLVTAFVALLFGFGGAALWSVTGLGHSQTRDYLLENPELLPQMAENLQRKEASARLVGVADQVVAPFPGAVLGNPEGTVTLVEFTDYGCSFCRLSREPIEALIAKNPDLRVVIREWPIFEGSDKAASMALAAAQQGKFAEFHAAMFDQSSRSEDGILAAAAIAELDLAKAEQFIEAGGPDYELSKNTGLARQLGFGGTPSWVVGDQAFEGAVGEEALQAAIDAARES